MLRREAWADRHEGNQDSDSRRPHHIPRRRSVPRILLLTRVGPPRHMRVCLCLPLTPHNQDTEDSTRSKRWLDSSAQVGWSVVAPCLEQNDNDALTSLLVMIDRSTLPLLASPLSLDRSTTARARWLSTRLGDQMVCRSIDRASEALRHPNARGFSSCLRHHHRRHECLVLSLCVHMPARTALTYPFPHPAAIDTDTDTGEEQRCRS